MCLTASAMCVVVYNSGVEGTAEQTHSFFRTIQQKVSTSGLFHMNNKLFLFIYNENDMAKKTNLFRSISNQIIIISKSMYMLSGASAHLISVL